MVFPSGFGDESAKMPDKSDLGIEDRRLVKLLVVRLIYHSLELGRGSGVA